MHPSIVCGIDTTTRASAIGGAARVAERFEARLVLFHAVIDVHRPRHLRHEADLEVMHLHERLAGLEMLRRGAITAGAGDAAECRCEIGDPVAWLTRVVQEEQAELLIVIPRNLHPMRKLLSGSVSAALMRRAPCPVLALPPTSLPEAPLLREIRAD